MEALDAGKPITDCLGLDVPETANCIHWHGEAQDKLYDRISPTRRDAVSVVVREPLGVVGAVLPWNFSQMMMAFKIGPALATGNAVIVEPAEDTSLTALRLAKLAIEAGLPPGILNVVTGMGPDVGEPLDPATRTGPLVSRSHYDKLAGLVERGKSEGAHLVTGEAGAGGLIVQPTVFADVTEGMDIFQTEIFGPVVAVTVAENDDAAIGLVNATRYGLAATLYAAGVSKAHRHARRRPRQRPPRA